MLHCISLDKSSNTGDNGMPGVLLMRIQKIGGQVWI